MFETLSKGFRAAKQRLTGAAELTDDVIDEALRDVRMSLLEADVEFKVTKRFLDRVKEAARGEQIQLRARAQEYGVKKITPEQAFIKICQDELTAMMGPVETELRWAKKGPTGIMMVGLQGSGKTTTVGKLARYLETEHGKKPCLVAADIYRPAAVDQLKTLGDQLGMPVFSQDGELPVDICKSGVDFALENGRDVILFDTAGRLAIDETLMQELEDIDKATHPANIFLVLDAMTGQDAVRTADTFNKRLNLDGVILTKLDGDARGGAALSVKEVIGKPIAFASTGEKLDAFEQFHPDRMAGRILGMGDMLTLIEQAEQAFEKEQAEEAAGKLLEGAFTLDDFLEQMQQLKKMGPLGNLLGMMPGMPKELKGAQIGDDDLKPVEAIIRSMTLEERARPQVINGSRRSRIAAGSGTTPADVNRLVKQFSEMQKMMKRFGMAGMGGGKKGKRRGALAGLGAMPGLSGGLPSGFDDLLAPPPGGERGGRR